MKFQSIFMFLILSLPDSEEARDPPVNKGKGRLTEEENEYRIKKCGNPGAILNGSTPAKGPDPIVVENKFWPYWMATAVTPAIKNISKENDPAISLATMISPRHFLTSSQVLFTDSQAFRYNKTDMHINETCTGNTKHYELHPEFVDKLIFHQKKCYDGDKKGCKRIKPVAAWLVNFCDKANLANFYTTHVPMVVEVDEDFDKKFWLCVPDDTSKRLPVKQWLHVFTYGRDRAELKHRVLEFAEYFRSWWLRITTHHEPGERGGPMATLLADKWYLVGLEATAFQKANETYGHNLRAFHDGLCELVGVCGAEIPTITKTPAPPAKPTEPPKQLPPPEPEPSKPPQTWAENNSTKNPPSQPSVSKTDPAVLTSTPTSSESSRKVTKSRAELERMAADYEYELYLRGLAAKEAELPDPDIDDDFMLSSDDWRVSSTRERTSRRARDDSASSSQKQQQQSQVETEKEEKAKRSEISQKSQRKETMDSIRVMRGRKPQRKARDPKDMKPDRSDSQHTEVINVPLGKAAKESESPSKLTENDQKKEVEQGKSPAKRVQFAEKLVKSSKTGSPAATAPPPVVAEKETSKKSKKSLKDIVSKKSRKAKSVKKKK